jgi:hypothetical protein
MRGISPGRPNGLEVGFVPQRIVCKRLLNIQLATFARNCYFAKEQDKDSQLEPIELYLLTLMSVIVAF